MAALEIITGKERASSYEKERHQPNRGCMVEGGGRNIIGQTKQLEEGEGPEGL